MKADTVKYVAYTVAIVAGAWVVYRVVNAVSEKGTSVATAVKETISDVIDAVNPASSDNLVYRGVSNVAHFIGGDGTSGQSTIPLGTRMWEWLNPAAVAKERAMLSNGTPDKTGRFMIGGDSDEFGNLIDRSTPVPSEPPYAWGPSVMGELHAP